MSVTNTQESLADQQRKLKAIACLREIDQPKEAVSHIYQIQPADVAEAVKTTLHLQKQGKLEQARARFSLLVNTYSDAILFTELWNRAQNEKTAQAAMDAWNALDLFLEDNVATDLEAKLTNLRSALAEEGGQN